MMAYLLLASILPAASSFLISPSGFQSVIWKNGRVTPSQISPPPTRLGVKLHNPKQKEKPKKKKQKRPRDESAGWFASELQKEFGGGKLSSIVSPQDSPRETVANRKGGDNETGRGVSGRQRKRLQMEDAAAREEIKDDARESARRRLTALHAPTSFEASHDFDDFFDDVSQEKTGEGDDSSPKRQHKPSAVSAVSPRRPERERARSVEGKKNFPPVSLRDQEPQGLVQDVVDLFPEPSPSAEPDELDGIETSPIRPVIFSGVSGELANGGDRQPSEYFFSKKQFEEMGASAETCRLAKSLGLQRPSRIQNLSWKPVRQREDVAIAEQTGSGKTLAYLLPLIETLVEAKKEESGKSEVKEEEEKGESSSALSKPLLPRAPLSPRVLILAPTSDLVEQVGGVVRGLCQAAGLTSVTVSGSYEKVATHAGRRNQKRVFIRPVDIAVGSPGRLSQLLREGQLSLEGTSSLVLDEIDILLLDEDYGVRTFTHEAPNGCQFLFVSATMPQEVAEALNRDFPGLKRVVGPGVHKVAAGVEEVLIDCTEGRAGKDEKLKWKSHVVRGQVAVKRKREALMMQLRVWTPPRTVVFCNSIDNCRVVENYLNRYEGAMTQSSSKKGEKEQQFTVLPHHSALETSQRKENLRQFCRENWVNPLVFVTTDQASRGIDFGQVPIDHVVLFDFPRDPSEYLRRVGRTGRAGRGGRVTVLAFGSQVGMARRLLAQSRRGDRIHEVPFSSISSSGREEDGRGVGEGRESDSKERGGGKKGQRYQKQGKRERAKEAEKRRLGKLGKELTYRTNPLLQSDYES
uniref:RNA helicase n=1 Tax=Chromera velia CCMP2878 TaxID=1169474 RepID=A0A0G4HTM6_9ALVE|eukprot:Cvel_8498.t1-p1 / transcript=Cvel_8498.t1 / gene=Cvel_8498 / organism=Chromera_velia_CCMP2878 / gene_product=DEAD-box ATP-dependent RNA helicase 50, putative / transcript_product=DEAD-box ATP-dependent RNA helicase 50, putative / location=Cvel_scaffold469:77719-80127(-) / protein_length=803 / sequence_SO=supercontig / SO=protein_coding / is_pseudo=false